VDRVAKEARTDRIEITHGPFGILGHTGSHLGRLLVCGVGFLCDESGHSLDPCSGAQTGLDRLLVWNHRRLDCGVPGGKDQWSPYQSRNHLSLLDAKEIVRPLALSYIGAQVLGAIAGAWLLSKVFGRWAFSVHDAVTLPGPSGDFLALAGGGGRYGQHLPGGWFVPVFAQPGLEKVHAHAVCSIVCGDGVVGSTVVRN